MGSIRRSGAGPTIVFIAQLGTDGESWRPVIDRLDRTTAFCYDRPGTGSAEPRPAPNPPLPHSAFAQELAAELDRGGITEPAVIVAHSFGGNIARVFAGLYPERVAGLVFVDSSIPQTFLMPDKDPIFDSEGPGGTEVDTVTGQVEILNAAVPDVPTVVLTRKPGSWDGQNPPPHPAIEDLWLVSQRIMAQTFNAPLIVAREASHQIPAEAPDLVAYAVAAVVDAVKTGSPVSVDPAALARLGGHLEP